MTLFLDSSNYMKRFNPLVAKIYTSFILASATLSLFPQAAVTQTNIDAPTGSSICIDESTCQTTNNISCNENAQCIFYTDGEAANTESEVDVAAVVEKGFTFEFLNCVVNPIASSPLTCNFKVENNHNSEKKLELYAFASRRSHSRVIDAQGNEILASAIQLGSSFSDRAVSTDFSPGIPMRLSLSFEAAPEGGIQLIDLGSYLYGNGGGSFDAEFRL